MDGGPKRTGLTLAKAPQDRNVAKAQIAALPLQLPDPPRPGEVALLESDPGRLARDLVACGLLEADDGWDQEHPRTGAPPNPGWFAPKPKDSDADKNPPSGRGSAASAAALAAGSGGLLDSELSAADIEGLATLAARVSVPTVLFGAIFVPSANAIVDEGPVPGRPDMAYRWAHDETTATFKVLIDGQWRTLAVGALGRDNLFSDSEGNVVARMALAAGRRPTLVTTVDSLDRAEAEMLRQDDQTIADTTVAGDAPKLRRKKPATSNGPSNERGSGCWPRRRLACPDFEKVSGIEHDRAGTGLDEPVRRP